MDVLADGGALADWTFVVDVFIAVGTVGAAGVALWLGIQAQRNSTAQMREARLKLTRQVVCVYHPPGSGHGPSIEIANASPEAITRVHVGVETSDVGEDAPHWEWLDDPAARFPTVDFLLAGKSVVLEGDFWPPIRPDADPLERRESVLVDAGQVNVSVTWEDSYGQVWGKRPGEEAFPTSWARPWRDLRNVYPWWAQPAHWPPKDQEHPREPFRERMKRRAQRIRYKLKREDN